MPAQAEHAQAQIAGIAGRARRSRSAANQKPEALRPAWNEKSIRERNLMLQNGIVNIMELEPGKDWVQIRRELTDDKIAKIYQPLRGPVAARDGSCSRCCRSRTARRAQSTRGSIHPSSIKDFAMAAPLYFGELIVAHPFVNSGVMKKEMRPTEQPEGSTGRSS